MLSNIRKIKNISFIFLLVIVVTGCSINGKKVYQSQNIAIKGFDPVAYFTEGKALKGNPKYQTNLSGVKWYFNSEKHRVMFEHSPEKYIPQYGGYCAYAMSYGLVVSSDPHAFTVIEDKLYLNYSLDVREKWLRNEQKYIRKADSKWIKKI